MDKQQYEDMLKSAFATEFAFYLKAANFHWNVEGSDFYEFHLIFERIYTEVYESIDDFAEELRSTRIYTPASLAALDSLSMVKGQDNMPLAAPSMAQELLADSDACAEMFRLAFDAAETMGDHGLSNFLADRQDAHKKHSWMLRSSLK
jgi:starvation-inducible DNA-binding protein